MKLKKYIILILAVVAFNKCAGFLEERLDDVIILDEYFQYRHDGVLVLYSGLNSLRGAFTGSAFLHTFEVGSDQLYFSAMDVNNRQMSVLNPQNNAPQLLTAWQNLYQAVGRMNMLLYKLETRPVFQGHPETPRIEANARFIRAFAYFQLVRLWGPVPITTAVFSDDVSAGNIFPARSSVAEVYEHIIADLLFGLEGTQTDAQGVTRFHLRDFRIDDSGQKVFPDYVFLRRPNDNIPQGVGQRFWLPASRSAAQLLLAQVYLTRNQGNDHQLAYDIVTEMINNPLHALLPDYENLFQSDRVRTPNRSREVLFELESCHVGLVFNATHREIAPNSVTPMKTGTGAQIQEFFVTPAGLPGFRNIPAPNNQLYVSGIATGFGRWIPTEHFLFSFDQRRDRRYFWLYQFVGAVSTLEKPSHAPNFRKGHDHLGNQNQGAAPVVLLRYAQAYLIQAELRARKGDGAGVAASLNPILARAGLDPFDPTGMDAQQLIDAVIDERAREFAHEAGDRLFTMRRVGFQRELERGFIAWHNWLQSIFDQNPGGPRWMQLEFINPHARGNPITVIMPNPAFRLEWAPVTHWNPNNPTAPNPAFNPPAPGDPDYEAFTLYSPDTDPYMEHYRQDQGVGGDRFLRNVPFLESPLGAVPFRKEYRVVGNYSRSTFHPIPIREVRENPTLCNNMHIPNFN